MTSLNKELVQLNGYSVRVDLPDGLTEMEYIHLVHHTHHMVLKTAMLDVVSLWICWENDLDMQVIPVLQDLPPEMTWDLTSKYLGLRWHMHLLLCFLPFDQADQKHLLFACQKRIEVDCNGKITYIGERGPCFI
ncbi:hypothetical protein [Deinococcus cellulosilyticus]|uniref:Uncharacterized protein n=1 Tax=Deinococcus cellulosilyticus (strain DSM 18568 / NBRC 106333 / KACC 11606 / 5516J-15) TaxID=1223518 RepID=A0A511NB73_DEIC1|nr:hypothetical protein [Deinococcus cellulosilyticus]GEM50054.1 hypothetical protein DC3_56890 [Deinococcus cellulosilyticus NBRC 106333 = KACC 11606]